MKQNCFVCLNIDCKKRGAEQLMKELTVRVAARSLDVAVKPYVCFGGCEHGPNVVIHPQRFWHARVKPEDVPAIVESLAGGPAVTHLDTMDASLKEMIFSLLDSAAF